MPGMMHKLRYLQHLEHKIHLLWLRCAAEKQTINKELKLDIITADSELDDISTFIDSLIADIAAANAALAAAPTGSVPDDLATRITSLEAKAAAYRAANPAPVSTASPGGTALTPAGTAAAVDANVAAGTSAGS